MTITTTTHNNSLPGHIGERDVADVLQATRAAYSPHNSGIDATRIAVVGGSHGGFLACHMTAQYPEVYKVAAMRNPVTNIAGA
jgi:acylaminoacyl-peptidase